METTSKYELDFLDAFHQCEEGKFSISQLAATITKKLSELAAWAKVMDEEHDAQEIEGLLEQFAFIAEDTTATSDELDAALEMLYDWGDGPGDFDSQGQPKRGVLMCRVRSSRI